MAFGDAAGEDAQSVAIRSLGTANEAAREQMMLMSDVTRLGRLRLHG